MNVIFRDTKGNFEVIDAYLNEPNFAVSITANTRGFLPALGYIHAYHLSLDKIQDIESKCNVNFKCAFIENLSPKVILVPHTKGKDSQDVIDDFLEVITNNNLETVHFTHYNWLLSFPEIEVKMLLAKLYNPAIITTLKKIIIDTPNVTLFENILSEIKKS